MPALTSARSAPSNRFIAPRALNEPVTWFNSSLKVTCAATGSGSRASVASMIGVRRTKGAMRSRAAWMSAISIMRASLGQATAGSNGRVEQTSRSDVMVLRKVFEFHLTK